MSEINKSYPPKGTIFDLEQAIKMHLDNQRKMILPQNNTLYNELKELHIRIVEKAPRDSGSLLKKIETRKAEKDRATNVLNTQKLIHELNALEWMLAIVRRSEAGKSLDGLAY